MVTTVKILYKRWRRSSFKLDDAVSIIIAWISGKHPLYISNSIHKRIKGKINTNSLALIGVCSNKIGLDRSSRGQFWVSKGASVSLGNMVRVARGCKIFVEGKMAIGNNTYIQPNANIVANKEVTIGSECAISWNFQALDDDLHTLIVNGVEKDKVGNIHIGNHVWIGCNVTILKNTEIADNCVIAAGSVVKGIFPPNCLIAGIPAKVVKENIDWK